MTKKKGSHAIDVSRPAVVTDLISVAVRDVEQSSANATRQSPRA